MGLRSRAIRARGAAIKAPSNSALKTASSVFRFMKSWSINFLVFSVSFSCFLLTDYLFLYHRHGCFLADVLNLFLHGLLNEFCNSAIYAILYTSLSSKNVVYISCLASTFLHASVSSSKFNITISDPFSSSSDFVYSASFLVNRPFAVRLWFLSKYPVACVLQPRMFHLNPLLWIDDSTLVSYI